MESVAGAFWLGVGGALPRPPLLKGGGGGGAEVLCFIPVPVDELLLEGREMSGSEGRWERWCSGGEGLLPGEGEVERPVGGRGAVGLDPGGLSAERPTEPPAEPSGWRTEGWCLVQKHFQHVRLLNAKTMNSRFIIIQSANHFLD